MSLADSADDRALARMSARTVLIADGDADVRTSFRRHLEVEGFAVRVAGTGPEALTELFTNRPHAVVLDWQLPIVSGMEICRHLRCAWDYRDLRIILSVGRPEDMVEVKGRNCGADEYLVRPVAAVDVVSTVRDLLLRPVDGPVQRILQFGDVRMDLTARRVFRNGHPIHLSQGLFRLLRFMLENAGTVLSRGQIIDTVWRDDTSVTPRTVDTAVAHLRRALNAPGLEDFLKTVPYVGYGLDVNDVVTDDLPSDLAAKR